MATIYHFPYYFTPRGGLAPGESFGVIWGPSNLFAGASVNVTGHPGGSRRVTYALQVADPSIINVVSGSGDIDYIDRNFSARFVNSGSENIEYFAAFLTITTD